MQNKHYIQLAAIFDPWIQWNACLSWQLFQRREILFENGQAWRHSPDRRCLKVMSCKNRWHWPVEGRERPPERRWSSSFRWRWRVADLYGVNWAGVSEAIRLGPSRAWRDVDKTAPVHCHISIVYWSDVDTGDWRTAAHRLTRVSFNPWLFAASLSTTTTAGKSKYAKILSIVSEFGHQP